MVVRVSMTIRAVADRQLRQMTKALSAWTVLSELADEIAFRRCQWNYRCQLEDFRALFTQICQPLVPKVITSEHKDELLEKCNSESEQLGKILCR
jgi:hypothetical protein